jgi:hypothetical protein
MTDFEEVKLEYSDDEPTAYETVKMSEKEVTYGTSRCGCNCHGTSGGMKRKTHCRKCALTVSADIIVLFICLGSSMLSLRSQKGPQHSLDKTTKNLTYLKVKTAGLFAGVD